VSDEGVDNYGETSSAVAARGTRYLDCNAESYCIWTEAEYAGEESTEIVRVT
jgi:hypothetical protein